MYKRELSFAITGMGMITPAGSDALSLWNHALEKKSFIEKGLGKISAEMTNKAWENISSSRWIKKNPTLLSRTLIFSLHSIINSIDTAGWTEFREDDLIVIGTTTGQISLWEKELTQYLKTNNTTLPHLEKLATQPLQSLSEDLSSALNFPGRILILASACSASAQAFIAAHDYLSKKRAGRVIAGGVEELSDLTTTGFSCLKLLGESPCKPFDESRVGINLSEGAAFYTIERSDRALGYLYAGETELDSYHMTSPSPEGAGLQESMKKALDKSLLTPENISLVYSHGTGSIHNDQAETKAINTIFENDPHVISTKGVHGHALGASSAIELGLCLMMLKEQKIPAVTGLSKIDPHLKVNAPTAILNKKIDYILKTTLGFGGVNASFIVGRTHA